MNGCPGMPTYCDMPSGRTPRTRLATRPKSGWSDRAVEVRSGRMGVLPVRTSIEPSLRADIVWCSERTKVILSPSRAWSPYSMRCSKITEADQGDLVAQPGLEREEFAEIH